MRRYPPLTHRAKMTCVHSNEWWVGKAWAAVGILTIWVSCVLLFAAFPHGFWKQGCKISLFHNICRERIGKKMKDGWAKDQLLASICLTHNVRLVDALCSVNRCVCANNWAFFGEGDNKKDKSNWMVIFNEKHFLTFWDALYITEHTLHIRVSQKNTFVLDCLCSLITGAK